uniref:COesterase domain-containing protein n=1 Tax=Macrostomum lignano TaxID=282301 RepID=A0A1I8I900_9PLAT
ALGQKLIVETDDAIYRGRVLSLNNQQLQQQTVAFLGIPYAQPPINELRFAAPLPWRPTIPEGNSSFKAELNATRAGPACLQRSDQSGTPGRMSEDCLYLNVHSPPGVQGRPKPVLVWLHGGFFETGSVSDPDQTGTCFGWDLVATRQSMLLVEAAYRLGVFGFLAEPEPANGNAGLKDQQMALAWVAKTSSTLAVTIAHRRISHAESRQQGPLSESRLPRGSPLAGWAFVRDLQALRTAHEAFYNLTGCTDHDELLNCLRALPADELNSHQSKFNQVFDRVEFPVIVDGQFLQSDPVEAFERGNFESKAVIIGVTSLEGIQLAYRALGAFNVTNQWNLTGQVHLDLLAEAFRYVPRFPEEPAPLASEFLQLTLTSYPGENLGARNFRLLTSALSEQAVVCDSNRMADLLLQAANGSSDTFFLPSSTSLIATQMSTWAPGMAKTPPTSPANHCDELTMMQSRKDCLIQ